MVGEQVGVVVGGAGVSVGRTGVGVGGTGVPVGGIGVSVGGTGVGVGGTGVSVGGTGVSVGQADVGVGATGVPVDGPGDAVGVGVGHWPPTETGRSAAITSKATVSEMTRLRKRIANLPAIAVKHSIPDFSSFGNNKKPPCD